MKKWMCMVLAMLLLSGCSTRETWETVDDETVQEVISTPRQILVDLPGDALAPVLKTEGEQVYLSRNYEIIIETRSAGDLKETVTSVSGYDPEALTVLQTRQQDLNRYEFVWACAGEGGDRLGRAVILDDGQYHYCMSVLRDAQTESTSQTSWEDVFSSFRIGQVMPGTAL